MAICDLDHLQANSRSRGDLESQFDGLVPGFFGLEPSSFEIVQINPPKTVGVQIHPSLTDVPALGVRADSSSLRLANKNLRVA
jgi:hypothetical protein